MNNKGFTLIELIATITIMGLVSLMAFPSISNSISSNKTSSCKYYEKAMIAAAKSYMQKESVDLLEVSSNITLLKNGTFKLTAKNLIDNLYLDKYSDSKTTIDTSVNGAYVLVKLDSNTNTYTYTVKITCKNINGKILYSK